LLVVFHLSENVAGDSARAIGLAFVIHTTGPDYSTWCSRGQSAGGRSLFRAIFHRAGTPCPSLSSLLSPPPPSPLIQSPSFHCLYSHPPLPPLYLSPFQWARWCSGSSPAPFHQERHPAAVGVGGHWDYHPSSIAQNIFAVRWRYHGR